MKVNGTLIALMNTDKGQGLNKSTSFHALRGTPSFDALRRVDAERPSLHSTQSVERDGWVT